MLRALPLRLLRLKCIVNIALVLLILSACGGGERGGNHAASYASVAINTAVSSGLNSSGPSSVSNSGASNPSSVSTGTAADRVVLSGVVTYDYVPHHSNHIGLDYSAIEQRPVRGAVVELLNELGQIQASTLTANNGSYSFSIQKNTLIKVRAKAQLLNNSSPSWDFKVTDNTAGNALYVLDGSLVSTGTGDSTRSLNAGSGWDGASYSGVRAAAPFAILDSIYSGVTRLIAAGNKRNLTPLELRWSTKNSTAVGDYTRGEIGTSFYNGFAIYILGDANRDTDEYDAHVLLHEWGHYLEERLFRSDSIGGDHSDGELLDLRVAMSEGFANAFSGMMTENPNYADASGAGQGAGFAFSIGRKNRSIKGFFSEGSIGSVIYNFYSSGINKTEKDFTSIFNLLTNTSYIESEALTSIFLFSQQARKLLPETAGVLMDLLEEQNIFGNDEYGSGESNSGGLGITLPVYKTVTANNSPVNICSSSDLGKRNKLGNSQFLKLNITQPGNYNIRLNKAAGAEMVSRPEFVIYQKGRILSTIQNGVVDNASTNLNLSNGIYILEVYDLSNRDTKNTDRNTICFNLRVAVNQ